MGKAQILEQSAHVILRWNVEIVVPILPWELQTLAEDTDEALEYRWAKCWKRYLFIAAEENDSHGL